MIGATTTTRTKTTTASTRQRQKMGKRDNDGDSFKLSDLPGKLGDSDDEVGIGSSNNSASGSEKMIKRVKIGADADHFEDIDLVSSA